MYTGKEICQGCKKTGEAVPRPNKNSLCITCDSALKEGLSIDFENKIEYSLVRDWHNGYTSFGMDNNLLDTLANELLSSLHNTNAKISNQISFSRSQCHGSVHYNIPTKIASSLNKFLDELNVEVRKIKMIKDDAEREARQAVSVEKNRIFNEGVEKGRELLFSLNNGDLTMDDFSKKITKY